MAEDVTIVTEQPTEQGLLADRVRFWHSWTRFVTLAACVVVALVIALRVFLT